MNRKQKTTPSFETDLTKTLFEYIFGDKFKGVLTLDDIKAQGVKDVLVIVTDEKNRKHILTSRKPKTIKQLGPGLGARWEVALSTAQARIESRDRLPGPRRDEIEEVDHEGCRWLVRSERNEGGEWIEKHRICTGYEGREPPCPLYSSEGE